MKLNKKQTRRESALNRLLSQLKRGTKTDKITGFQIKLTDRDEKRIEKEIEILKSRT